MSLGALALRQLLDRHPLDVQPLTAIESLRPVIVFDFLCEFFQYQKDKQERFMEAGIGCISGPQTSILPNVCTFASSGMERKVHPGGSDEDSDDDNALLTVEHSVIVGDRVRIWLEISCAVTELWLRRTDNVEAKPTTTQGMQSWADSHKATKDAGDDKFHFGPLQVAGYYQVGYATGTVNGQLEIRRCPGYLVVMEHAAKLPSESRSFLDVDSGTELSQCEAVGSGDDSSDFELKTRPQKNKIRKRRDQTAPTATKQQAKTSESKGRKGHKGKAKGN